MLTGWTGIVTATVCLDGQVTRKDTFANLITDAGLSLLAHVLDGGTTDGLIRYMAVGTDDIAPANGDTKLGSEFFRKQITKQTFAAPGTVESQTYLSPADAVGSIREIGWFAGTGATAAVDSGVMIARVLYSHDKTALESINLDRTDTIGRA